ncbi:MAG: hypothetical protein VXZ39_11365, partial [Planctomycetota bacterium]|nr:hypothetical protein [Planctomycetota bacterium]
AIMKAGLSMGAFETGLDGTVALPWADVVRGTGSPVAHSLAIFSSLLLVQNLLLFIFNLFPIPPMDGSAALPLVIPEGPMHKVRALFAEPWAPFVGLIVAWNLFPEVFYPAFRSVMKLLVS